MTYRDATISRETRGELAQGSVNHNRKGNETPMNTQSATTGINCSACGEELTVAEVRFMCADTDFLQHGPDDHYAGFEPTARNFHRARMLRKES